MYSKTYQSRGVHPREKVTTDEKMSIIITRWAFFLLLASSVTAQRKIFNIGSYGGRPNGDITQALTNAWKDACASIVPSLIAVPKANYNMGVVLLKGPCKAPSIELHVEGVIRAPSNVAQMKGASQWVQVAYVNAFTLSGNGVFDGQGPVAWKQNDCTHNKKCNWPTMNFGFNFINNSYIMGVTSKDSKNFHVNVISCHNINFSGFKISAPEGSPNTDGIHIGRSKGVTVKNTRIGTGDDCVSIGDGNSNITVENVSCGPGHGISVGSLGRYNNEAPVVGVIIKNCTLTNTMNGVRIKTWPGTPGAIQVSNLHFEDIVMNNVSNPVIIDQEYCPWNQCNKKSPSKIRISNVSFKNIRGTSGTAEGVSLICSAGVPCQNVELNNINLTFKGAKVTAKCSHARPRITANAPAC
ncbi:hypothetical protein QN277_019282 [Acacia crassicarpa]|uniref:Polygalacturonase n=2 Tax=Acacia crassicarpa TaxID=499986 RepID=A0AAE1KKM6_9FABA|nr:hypothetical protein QN277_019282 [Acacia crassicarpa]